MLSINDKVKRYTRSRKLKRRYSLFVSVLCIVTATSVCSSLIMPAISTTDRMEYYGGDAHDELKAIGIDRVTTYDEDIIPTDEETTSDEVVTARVRENILKGAETEATFSDYSIANILANYEIFISGDIETNNHFTGAAACGGTMILGKHGGASGGRLAPDYAEKLAVSEIEDNTNLNPNIYYKEYLTEYQVTQDKKDEDGDVVRDENGNVVKETITVSNNPSPPEKSKQSDNYINMEEAFNQIKAESLALSQDTTAKTLTATTIKLNSDPTKNKFILPYSVLENNEILIDATDYSGDIKLCGLTLSITGVGENKVELNTYPNYVKVKYKSDTGEEVTKSIRDACGGQKQFDFSGLNILFNFPDATGKVMMNEMAGHVVAPNADIEYKGGEGGGIGKTLEVSNEIHMFPYKSPESDPTPPSKYGKMIVKKAWLNSNEEDITSNLDNNYSVKVSIYSTTNPPVDGKVQHLEGDKEVAKDIVISSTDNWQTIQSNLPLTNEKGETLYYYVVEDKNSDVKFDENIYNGWEIFNCNIQIVGEDSTNNAVITNATFADNKYPAYQLNESKDTEFVIRNKLKEKETEYNLPETGGIGTWKVCLAGFTLAAISTTALILGRKKRSENDK